MDYSFFTELPYGKTLQERCNPKSFVYAEQHVRRALKWAVRNFDQTAKTKFGFSNGNRHFELQRNTQCPQLLARYANNKIITADQYDVLIAMLKSEDRDDWYMAFNCILALKSINPRRK